MLVTTDGCALPSSCIHYIMDGEDNEANSLPYSPSQNCTEDPERCTYSVAILLQVSGIAHLEAKLEHTSLTQK